MDSFVVTGKKVAIIGAGMSGLVSLKEALATGLQPVLFESKSEGG
jgi:cation diffusion facilitator CzcD-associated flavoprotein CzcO